MFKLAVVGSQMTISYAQEIAEKYFDGLLICGVAISPNDDIAHNTFRIIESTQECDAIIYSTLRLYFMYGSAIKHTVPVKYIEIDEQQILITLCEVLMSNHSVSTITTDIKSFKHIMERLKTSSSALSNLTVLSLDDDWYKQDVYEIAEGHIANFKSGETVCITEIMSVFEFLKQANIPVYFISHSANTWIREIRNLMTKKHMNTPNPLLTTALYINLRYKESFRFLPEIQLKQQEELSHINQLLHLYAMKLNSISIPLSRWEHLIISENEKFEEISNNYRHITLMEEIDNQTSFAIFMAIGIGKTVKDSYSNVMASYAIGVDFPNSIAIITNSDGITLPHIHAKEKNLFIESPQNKELRIVAKKTGIGISTLNKLNMYVQGKNSKLFTSKEIADVLLVSDRTANRLIAKLIASNCAIVVGTDAKDKKGRPIRYIRLQL